jgi:serine/threonine-protein kinase
VRNVAPLASRDAGAEDRAMTDRDDDRTELSSPMRADRFGPYRVLESLGRGGMGEVHLAVHTPSDGVERLVALKRLRRDLGADKRFARMFLDEMRIATRVSHPNVCRVLDAGRIDGVAYLAMDLLVGMPLSGLLAHARASTDPQLHESWPYVVCRIGADACEGLHAAHELRDARGELLGVVHRDVSPDNLFVGFDGVTRVIDFGIASATEKLHRTATGELRGKIAYASPERLADQSVDRRTDVFSMGAVLWEAIALRSLFPHHDPAAAMRAIRQGLAPPLRDVRPDVPLDLDAIVAQALAVEPARRFPTTRAMSEALHEVMSTEGRAIGAPHVAAWMDRLFAGAHARQERLVSHALSVETDPSARVAAEGRARTSLAPAAATTRDALSTTLAVRDPRFPLLIGGALLAGLGLGLGLGVWLASS